MWDLLFNTFPCPVGTWKWRWCVGTFVCTRVLFIWETLEPEALLQLSLPRVILPLYSRGKHTSTFNTRHPCAHTSHGERERERKKERGQDQKRETAWKCCKSPSSRCIPGKLLEWNNIRPRTALLSRLNTQHACLPHLERSLDFHRLHSWTFSSYVEKVAKEPAELINDTATKTQKTGPLLAAGSQRPLQKKALWSLQVSSKRKCEYKDKDKSSEKFGMVVKHWKRPFWAQTLHFDDWDKHRGRSLSLRFSTEIFQS